MNKKLLIVNKAQFGYHIDSYYYCKFLPENYDITYVCFDEGREKLALENVCVRYCNSKGKYSKRALKFFILVFQVYLQFKPQVVFIKYFLGSSFLLSFMKRRKTIIDVRTGSVSSSVKKRYKNDKILRFELKWFKHITVISEGLKKRLKLKMNTEVIPLGAIQISNVPKKYEKLNLLYVGTFENRNIEITVRAVAKYVEEIGDDISYQIIGFGSNKDVELIQKEIQKNNLKNIVSLEGRIPVNQLGSFFDKNNVGVAFVPITDYYDHQPPTKIFEYAMSGLLTIATGTSINRTLINQYNGVTCADNLDGFYNALIYVKNNLAKYDHCQIINSLNEYDWENIVRDKLLLKLKKVIG